MSTSPSTLQRILSGSFWVLLERTLRLGLGFVVGVAVARHFGPTDYGRLNYLLAAATLLQPLASLGIESLVVRDLASGSRQLSWLAIQSNALALRLVSGAAAYAAFVFATYLEDRQSDLWPLSLLYGVSYLLQASEVFEYALRCRGEFRALSAIRALSATTSSLLRLGVVLFSFGLPYLVAAILAELLVAFPMLYQYLRRFESVFDFHGLSWNYVSGLLTSSWKLVLAGLITMAQARLEYFLLASLLDWTSVGQYSAALRVIELFDLVSVVAVTVVLPEFSKRMGADGHVAQHVAKRAYFAAFASFSIVFPFVCLASYLFPLVYGPAYGSAGAIVLLLAPRPLLALLGMIRNMLIVTESRLWYPSICALAGIISAAISGLLLIPRFGIYGAAVSTIISFCVSNFLIDLLLNKRNAENILHCWREWRYFIG